MLSKNCVDFCQILLSWTSTGPIYCQRSCQCGRVAKLTIFESFSSRSSPKNINNIKNIKKLTKESSDEVRCMVGKPGHVDAAETGQKVALLVEVRVAWDLRVVGTLGEVLISMVIRRGGKDE